MTTNKYEDLSDEELIQVLARCNENGVGATNDVTNGFVDACASGNTIEELLDILESDTSDQRKQYESDIDPDYQEETSFNQYLKEIKWAAGAIMDNYVNEAESRDIDVNNLEEASKLSM